MLLIEESQFMSYNSLKNKKRTTTTLKKADDVADDVEIELATSSVAKKLVDVHSDTSNNGFTESANVP
jgi:hypothetical protein